MDYTYQEKCVAAIECKLWWRFPNRSAAVDREWSRVTDDLNGVEASDLNEPDAEYHIGEEPPKPPRVLSDLERELLEALREVVAYAKETGNDWMCLVDAQAAIAKAEGEA